MWKIIFRRLFNKSVKSTLHSAKLTRYLLTNHILKQLACKLILKFYNLIVLRQQANRFNIEQARSHFEKFTAQLQLLLLIELYLLQIRPIVDSKQMLDEDLDAIDDEQCLLRSDNSLGHGVSEDVVDVVYVKTGDNFSAANNPAIADDVERINRRFLDEGKNYVLIGPGRWGSSDNWLGIPVKWPHISAARIIVEAGLENYRVDPSQGTHFFQNLTSFGVGYFTINAYMNDGLFRQDLLDAMPAVTETQYVRHIRFDKPLKIMMDGKKQKGLVVV